MSDLFGYGDHLNRNCLDLLVEPQGFGLGTDDGDSVDPAGVLIELTKTLSLLLSFLIVFFSFFGVC
jgi:hypothetical protein